MSIAPDEADIGPEPVPGLDFFQRVVHEIKVGEGEVRYYVHQLMKGEPTPEHAEEWARFVHELAEEKQAPVRPCTSSRPP